MSAFFIFHSAIKDPEKFKRYASAVGATLVKFKGEVSLRGTAVNVQKGKHDYQNVGVLRIPDLSNAEGWYQSEDYQALVSNRGQAADIVVISFVEPES